MRVLVSLVLLQCHLGFSLFFSLSTDNHDATNEYNDGQTGYKSQRKRILNCTCGIYAKRNSTQFPWNVYITKTSEEMHSTFLKNDTSNYCGGTVINDKIILTSVQCVLKLTPAQLLDEMPKPLISPEESMFSPENLKVWIPQSVHFDNEKTEEMINDHILYNVSHLYYHPKYLLSRTYYGKEDFDIAFLTLKERINFNDSASIVPVCLPTKSLSEENIVGQQTEAFDAGFDSFQSFVYDRMRCRINSGKKWISERFLCTLAPSFDTVKKIKIGSAVIINENGIATQYGIHSFSNHFPLLLNKKPISLSTNVAGFLEKIEKYSEEMGGKWCSGEPMKIPSIPSNFNPKLVNELIQSDSVTEWEKVSSDTRNVRKTCKCGVVNSLAFSSKGRIQGGSDAIPYEYGWIVQLISKHGNSKQFCGGSLINNKIVLTAAHCVFKLNNDPSDDQTEIVKPEDLEVHISKYEGPFKEDQESFLAGVEAVIPHPQYSLKFVKNDIALIILNKPLDFRHLKGKVSPICFPETNENLTVEGRGDAKIIGWGRTVATKKGSHAKKLQELQVKTISSSDCESILQKHGTFVYQLMFSDGKRLCAGTFRNFQHYKDPAQGDSGGPLVLPIQNGSQTLIQIGVASLITMNTLLEKNLKDVETVTLYTRTQSYLNFVDYHSLIADAVWCSR